MAKKKSKVTVTHPFSSPQDHMKHLQKKYDDLFDERLKKLAELKIVLLK
tara:strand:- start:367 stop:513 length:147 start_codon:yes stop_codon:yes gene_type:complete